MAIEKIEGITSTWPGINFSIHKYGGLQINYLKKEIGHIHSNGLLDILFTKKQKEDLIKNHNALEHHIFKNSGWISFYIHSEVDTEQAIFLLELSYLQNLCR